LESELAEFKSKISAFDGVDANEIKTLLKEKAEAEKTKLEAKGQWDALKEQMAKEHAAEKEAIRKTAEEAREQVAKANAVIERLTLVHQFDSSPFIKGELLYAPRKMKAIYGDHFDIDENGSVVGYDKPRGEGNRTPLVNGQGDPVTFDEALERLVKADPDYEDMLKSKRRAGAGSSSTATASQKVEHLSGLSKIEAGLRDLAKK